ncbi:MAG: glycogen phosphorylase [Desulfovibrionales bacterium]|nr:glycogen phosphorylase [Desulfovibrionales bacterium]
MVPFSNASAAPSVYDLIEEIAGRLVSDLGLDPKKAGVRTCQRALAYALRARLTLDRIRRKRFEKDHPGRIAYILCPELLPGPLLGQILDALDLSGTAAEALKHYGVSLEQALAAEPDPSLGAGGVGRLMADLLEASASLGLPVYAYGLRYEYGGFRQAIEDGEQVESPDGWLHYGNPWEHVRRDVSYLVRFYGGEDGEKNGWRGTAKVAAEPCDMLLPGRRGGREIKLRLWSARPSRRFNIDPSGDYIRSMQDTVRVESISKVLFPEDAASQNRPLRLLQEHFFVSASLQDILRRFEKSGQPAKKLAEAAMVHLHETRGALAVAEMMRLLVDERGVGWSEAKDVCRRLFAYTCHTLAPESHLRWPVDLLEEVLPRHLSIIYQLNHDHLEAARNERTLSDTEIARLSMIEETPVKRVRMAHLAFAVSGKTTGVSSSQVEALRQGPFRELDQRYPGRLTTTANGVSHRVWLLQSNPDLAEIITNSIGPAWIKDPARLAELIPLAHEPNFQSAWRSARRRAKLRLCAELETSLGIHSDPNRLFDVHVQPVQAGKRQLLNILHVLWVYETIKSNPSYRPAPRLKIFAGKAAPSAWLDKLVIRLIHLAARTINADPRANQLLQVAFLPDYRVSLAKRIVPAADLFQQIALAGTEGSGTGNMKFTMNGALVLGTPDGANLAIRDELGADGTFLFGLTGQEAAALRSSGYDAAAFAESDERIRLVLEALRSNRFGNGQPNRLQPLIDALTREGDPTLVWPDFGPYLEAQCRVEKLWTQQDRWLAASIQAVGHAARFSADRLAQELAAKTWSVSSRNLSS